MSLKAVFASIKAGHFVIKNWKMIIVAVAIIIAIPFMLISAAFAYQQKLGSQIEVDPAKAKMYYETVQAFNSKYASININWYELYVLDYIRNKKDMSKVTKNSILDLAKKFIIDEYQQRSVNDVAKILGITKDDIKRALSKNDPVVFPSNSFFAFPSPKARIVISPYGYRIHPILKTQRMHWGIDLVGNGDYNNSPILSIYHGTVIFAAWNDAVGYNIKIQHTIDGKVWYSRYCHLSSMIVIVGDVVLKGQQIGKLGGTGILSTGPHLHFELSPDGKITDPAPFIF